jgi:hypothetical protein
MFIIIIIIIPKNAHVNSIQFILKLLRHVSVFLRHLQGAYNLCQLKQNILIDELGVNDLIPLYELAQDVALRN